MKKQIGSFITGAIATAAIPPGVGAYDWRIIVGAAALGGIGGLCGINVAKAVKSKARRARPTP